MTMHCLQALPKKKGQKKQFKGQCGYCGEIGHKATNCPDKKSKKKEDSQDKSDKKETQKPKNDSKGKGKTNMTKIKCHNCGEMGHFPGTVRNHAKMLILLKKVSKIENLAN